MMGARVLVTGAGGFIGSHLVEQLVESGIEVRALVSYNSCGSHGWLDHLDESVKQSFEVVAGDIRDANFIADSMRGCEAVMHLAALVGIPYSYSAPDSYVDTNIKGTLNICQAALRADVSTVIHTSTSEVYGSAQYVPIDEKHPLIGQSPYSASKIGADQLALSFHSSFDLPVTIVRPFNTYGPRQSARAIIPTVISQLLSGAMSLSLGSLDPTRDLTFVSDTAAGFIAALKSSKSAGHVINLGCGFEISVRDLVSMICSIMNMDVEIDEAVERIRPPKSEVQRLWSDNTKASDLLGWSPHYTGLEGLQKGLGITIDWFSKNENQSTYRADRYNV